MGDFQGDPLQERLLGHHAEVKIASGSHCNSTSRHLLVTYDKDIRQLLQRMLAYFIRDLLVSEV
jgi:hypothetical protein